MAAGTEAATGDKAVHLTRHLQRMLVLAVLAVVMEHLVKEALLLPDRTECHGLAGGCRPGSPSRRARRRRRGIVVLVSMLLVKLFMLQMMVLGPRVVLDARRGDVPGHRCHGT